MSRRFDGTDDAVYFPVQSLSNFTGAFTLAIVARRRSIGTWDGLLASHASGGSIGPFLEWKNSDGITAFVNNAGSQDPSAGWTFTSTTDWWILGVTKSVGTSLFRFHRKNLTAASAWEHSDSGGTGGNASSQSLGYFSVGDWEGSDQLDGNVAVDAGWDSDLLDADIEELSVGSTTDAWLNHSISPVFLHQHNQTSATDTVEDLMGNGHDSTDIFGTTMEPSVNPPSWIYYGQTASAFEPDYSRFPKYNLRRNRLYRFS